MILSSVNAVKEYSPMLSRLSVLSLSLVAALALCLATGCERPASADAPKTKEGSEKPRFLTSRKTYRKLSLPQKNKGFTFAVLGDRTGGLVQGLHFLKETVRDLNVSEPDLVMTVGDLIQGYCEEKKWLHQMKRYRKIMDSLTMPWFPVAGNHDVYWRGEGKARPRTEHDDNYEKHFGPLWYAFEYQNNWFVVLYSDEGEKSGKKGWTKARRQKMSRVQFEWLQKTLAKTKGAENVFVFLHHPRWMKKVGKARYGNDWDRVHQLLVDTGNVRAVFAGHIHAMTYGGVRDGIEYFTLATTGGYLRGISPKLGFTQHYFMVTVRNKKISVASHPTGKVINPRTMAPKPVNLGNLKKITTLVKTPFHIKNKATRNLRYPIELPPDLGRGKKGRHFLIAYVSGAADDTGDKGLNIRLLDGTGQTVMERKVWRDGKFWLFEEVQPGSRWTLVLSDHDTAFTGKYPGNGGEVAIMVGSE